MKLNKFVHLLALALILSGSVVGCRKGMQKTTILPGMRSPTVGGERPGAIIDPAPPIPPVLPPIPVDAGAGATSKPTTDSGYPTTDRDFTKWGQNADIFAAQTVHFDFDKAVVKASDIPHVEAVATQLKGMAGRAVRIEGHCDERGTEEYNRSLGERRALAVREKLISLGVAADMIDTISFGEDRPDDPGHNEAAWSKNRRGVFILLTPPGAN